MGFEADQPLVAGTVLIRSDIRSQNYAAGVSGWIIEADGDAEFNDLTVRGELFVDGDNGSQISIEKANVDGSMQPLILMTPGDPTNVGYYEAQIFAKESFTADPERVVQLSITGPGHSFLEPKSSIRLVSVNNSGTEPQHIEMYGQVQVNNMAGSAGNLSVEGSVKIGNAAFTAHSAIEIDAGVIGFTDSANPADTNLYRAAANVLKTDDAFTAVGGVNSGFVYQQTVTYTAGGTFTKASFPNATRLKVRLVGGGGGGGGAGSNGAGTNSTAGGGGGGAYAESWLSVSALGVSETVTVGSGGSGGGPATNGNAGNVSSFGGFVSANGGLGGGGGGSSTTWFNVSGGQSQGTATGQLTIPGGPGSWGQRNGASYVAGQQMGGNGGSSALGFGGRGENNGTGSAGNNYGGGGGGTAGSQSTGGFTGGVGGQGIVIVDLYG